MPTFTWRCVLPGSYRILRSSKRRRPSSQTPFRARFLTPQNAGGEIQRGEETQTTKGRWWSPLTVNVTGFCYNNAHVTSAVLYIALPLEEWSFFFFFFLTFWLTAWHGGILVPQPGIEHKPSPWQWKHRVSTARPPRKSQEQSFWKQFLLSFLPLAKLE